VNASFVPTFLFSLHRIARFSMSGIEAAPPYSAQAPNHHQNQVPMAEYSQQQVNAPTFEGQPAQPINDEKAPAVQPQQQLQQPPNQPAFVQQQSAPQVFQSAVPVANLGANPAPVDCPICHARAMTRVTKETGNTNLAWAIGACLVCCCLAFIPFVMDSLKNVRHQCGNCGATLALWHKSGRTDVLAHA